MNATEKRIFIPLLKRVLNDTINHGTKSTARYWLHRLQKPRSKPSAQRKEAKAAQHREGLQTKSEGLPAVAFPKPDGGADREKKRTKHAASTRAIWEAVRARAAGVCEGCRKRWGFWLWTMDHWENGIGRKRQKQAVSNCWALCGNLLTPDGCHYRRQRYIPSVAFWNERFAAHATKHGYDPAPHILHADLPRKAAP